MVNRIGPYFQTPTSKHIKPDSLRSLEGANAELQQAASETQPPEPTDLIVNDNKSILTRLIDLHERGKRWHQLLAQDAAECRRLLGASDSENCPVGERADQIVLSGINPVAVIVMIEQLEDAA
ncbi:MAG: hypothetical protein AAFP90_17730 [Planctomycetota bacterium]